METPIPRNNHFDGEFQSLRSEEHVKTIGVSRCLVLEPPRKSSHLGSLHFQRWTMHINIPNYRLENLWKSLKIRSGIPHVSLQTKHACISAPSSACSFLLSARLQGYDRGAAGNVNPGFIHPGISAKQIWFYNLVKWYSDVPGTP